ncbi:MAG: ribosome recycling factor [Alphaproteobacteria bacterium]|nr:ribosome recycling factor [Alphaproteobacteria bacterium]MDE2630151.1 ribosome recycling factor [Alphaproteobacteria bacterium]
MSETYNKDEMIRRMKGVVTGLKGEFAGLRTGRASPALLDPVTVDAYGNQMHISQLGTISTPEPRLLTVQVWDRSMVKTVDKAIRDAGLGLNPQADGQLLRIPIPELNEERRKELVKLAHKYAEQGRVAVRNVRRDGMELLKKLEKDHKIGQDEHHKLGDDLQKLTDGHIKDIDHLLQGKEQEIMQV